MLFFFNDTATTEIYTLSLHDALPISKIDLSIEIIQTASFIQINQYSKNTITGQETKSESIVSNVKRRTDGLIELSFSYTNAGDTLDATLGMHYGFCILSVNRNSSALFLRFL